MPEQIDHDVEGDVESVTEMIERGIRESDIPQEEKEVIIARRKAELNQGCTPTEEAPQGEYPIVDGMVSAPLGIVAGLEVLRPERIRRSRIDTMLAEFKDAAERLRADQCSAGEAADQLDEAAAMLSLLERRHVRFEENAAVVITCPEDISAERQLDVAKMGAQLALELPFDED